MTSTTPRPPSWDYVMIILAANIVLWLCALGILHKLKEACQ